MNTVCKSRPPQICPKRIQSTKDDLPGSFYQNLSLSPLSSFFAYAVVARALLVYCHYWQLNPMPPVIHKPEELSAHPHSLEAAERDRMRLGREEGCTGKEICVEVTAVHHKFEAYITDITYQETPTESGA